MGVGGMRGSVVREHVDGTKKWVSCPRCAEQNPQGAPRCRDCLTPLSNAGSLGSPPRIPPTKVAEEPRLDALWGELEELTRADDLVRFQCPVCSRLVDGAATRCACGAVFVDAGIPVAFECPVCGARVEKDAVRCRCGARFSD